MADKGGSNQTVRIVEQVVLPLTTHQHLNCPRMPHLLSLNFSVSY